MAGILSFVKISFFFSFSRIMTSLSFANCLMTKVKMFTWIFPFRKERREVLSVGQYV